MSVNKTLLLLLSGLTGFGFLLASLLKGHNIALMHSRGMIATEQRTVLVVSTLIVLIIAIPTVLLLYFVAWKYRESNTKATYNPKTSHGKAFSITAWALPTVFMLLLAFILVPSTHQLAPKKQIASNVKPVRVQVVAMRWKWLFIYPEQHIATVNYLQIPKDTPIEFEITADDAPMSSFWIPNIGGQIYAMTGHVNSLHLIANTVGDYPGSSAEINGAGFAGMKFTAHVSSEADFETWAKGMNQYALTLDANGYKNLVKPSENNAAAFYSIPNNNLYDTVIMKYMGSHDHQTNTHEGTHE